jgi:hypothetical protein
MVAEEMMAAAMIRKPPAKNPTANKSIWLWSRDQNVILFCT